MKKQNTSAFAYLLKNFLGIAILTIIPSLILGFCRQDAKRAEFYVNMFSNNISRENYMKSLVRSFTIVGIDENFPILVVGVLLAIVSISLLLSKINRHMHLGVSSFRGLLRPSASNFFKVFIVVVFFLVIEIILNLLVIGLMYFVAYMQSAFWRDAVLIVLFSLSRLFLGYLICLMGCALPAVQEEGYRLNIASSYSVRLVSREKNYVWKFMLAVLLSHLLSLVLCGFLDLWYLQFVVCSVYYFAWLSFLMPLFCAKFIEVSNGERKDISKSIFQIQGKS